jgi:hypothetical protein
MVSLPAINYFLKLMVSLHTISFNPSLNDRTKIRCSYLADKLIFNITASLVRVFIDFPSFIALLWD